MTLTVYGEQVNSRLLLGTALYPSPKIMLGSIESSGAGIVTVSLRRESSSDQSGAAFWDLIKDTDLKILPNTAGCHTVKEAVNTAHMARELFKTTWIKLELISNDDTLNPAVIELVEAAGVLASDGFKIFPYTTDDLSIADQLINVGCEVLMPWGAPIGSGRGLNNPFALRAMRAHFPDTALIVDAGIGLPSHAAQAMEMGFDAVLLNTAVAKAGDPVQMATAFSNAVSAGRNAYEASPMQARDFAAPSTPTMGLPFWNT